MFSQEADGFRVENLIKFAQCMKIPADFSVVEGQDVVYREAEFDFLVTKKKETKYSYPESQIQSRELVTLDPAPRFQGFKGFSSRP